MNPLFAMALPGFLGGIVGAFVMLTVLHYAKPKPAPKAKRARKPRSKTVERSEPKDGVAPPSAPEDCATPW